MNSSLQLSTFKIFNSKELEDSNVVKLERGYFGKATGRIDINSATDTYFLHLYNAAELPSDTETQDEISNKLLMVPQPISHTNGQYTFIDIDFTPSNIVFRKGLVWCFSTTEFTKTITTNNVGIMTILYK